MNVTTEPNDQPTSSCASGSRPRATVVVVSYNCREKLLACLDSALASLPVDCEIIVVDNGSTEGNADAVAERFPRAMLIRSADNLGFGGGCNRGAGQSRGEYLVFLNPDTLVEPGWLDALLKPFANHPAVGLTTSKILLRNDPDRLNACGNDIHITGLTLCRGAGQSRNRFPRCETVGAISGAAAAIPADLFRKLGGFDDDFFLYLEDTDLSWRARMAGRESVYVPDSIVLHDYELRITAKKVFWQERNRLLMLLKSLRWPTLVLLMPSLCLAELITWGFVLLKDRSNVANKWRAYSWIVANWRHVLAKRRATQHLRRAGDRVMIKSTGFRIEFEQAVPGLVAAVARFVFNPLFFVLRAGALALVWW